MMTKRKTKPRATPAPTQPESPTPIMQPDGTVTMGAILIGQWGANGMMYRFVANDRWVKSFNETTAADLVAHIQEVYGNV